MHLDSSQFISVEMLLASVKARGDLVKINCYVLNIKSGHANDKFRNSRQFLLKRVLGVSIISVYWFAGSIAFGGRNQLILLHCKLSSCERYFW